MEIKMDQPLECVEPSTKRKRGDIKCEQCQIEMSKYSCPKCGFRSCSVVCVKKHKEVNQCDGMPQIWQTVKKITHFTPHVSIRDQHFFEEVQKRLHTEETIPAQNNVAKPEESKQLKSLNTPPPQNNTLLPRQEYLLLKSTGFRRILLKFDAEHPIDGSRHETFSDTIFWTVRLRFVRSNQQTNGLQLLSSYASPPSTAPSSPLKQSTTEEDGELTDESEIHRAASEDETHVNDQSDFVVDTVGLPKPTELIECFSHKVRDIPETITVRTLIKQFVRPKLHGPVVSKGELNLIKLEPFLNCPDSCLVYMETDVNGTTKYIPINQTQTILENLRNRTIHGHPEFLVALNTDRFDFEQPTQSDLESIRPAFYRQHNNHSFNNRGHQRNTPCQNNRRGGFNQNNRYQGRARPFQQRGGRRF